MKQTVHGHTFLCLNTSIYTRKTFRKTKNWKKKKLIEIKYSKHTTDVESPSVSLSDLIVQEEQI